MMHTFLLSPLLVSAIIANGLLAGLFFVFSVAISLGLRRVDDATYVRAFRAINTTILNGKFLTVFFLAPIAAVACAILHFLRDGPTSPPAVAVGAVCSVLTFGITAAGNIPLNQDLDRAPINTKHQRRTARQRFEKRWNRRNLARTITSTSALSLLTIAAVTA